MDNRPPVTQPRRRIPSWLPQVLGYGLSAGCLAWVLWGYPVGDLIPAIRSLDWRWVSLAVVADLSVYVCHGWRWNVLLAPLVRLRLWRTVQAIYIGLFANEVLPLRTGEVIRCYLLAHWNTLQLSVTFASAALERIIDGFWMVLAFLVTAAFVKGIPGELVLLVQVVGGLLLIGAILLLWIVFHKHHAHSVIQESRWATALRHIIEGLHLMGNARTMSRTALVSLIYLLLQIVSVYALMKAYGLDLSFWVAAGVLTIVRFGTVVPNAPGNLGLFQAACVVALGLFDVEKTDAKTFSFVMFFALTMPLLIGGAIAVAISGLNIGELRDQARQSAEAAVETPGSQC
jgi:glycosyltransferase 2 family protein